MLTSCGGMLSDFLNVIPEEFHTAILKKHTTILLESFPFQITVFCVIILLLCALLIFQVVAVKSLASLHLFKRQPELVL